MPGDFDPWELFEVVEVNAKKKKRSMCKLCGERWWDIGPAFILLHFGFDPQREVQKKYGKCAKINDPANSVWREKCAVYHANAMQKKDAKKAAKVQGGFTQQSAEDAAFRQSGVDVESARSAGLLPPVNSALVRSFANHKPPKATIAPEGGPSTPPQVGPSTLVQASPMLSTVSLGVKKQLDEKWAAAFYECGIPFEVASSEAFREAVEDTARLVRMPDDRFALVLTGLGAGKVGARRLHEPKPEQTWWRSPRRCGLARAIQPQRCAAAAREAGKDRHARI